MAGPPETFKLFDDHGSPGSTSSGDIPMRRAKRSVSWNDLALSEEAIVPPCLMAPSILRRQESQEKRARSVGPRSAEATWFVRAAGDRVGFDLTDDGTVTQLDAAPPRAASPSSPFSTQQHGSLRLGDRIRSVNGVVVAHRADILAALPGVRAFVLFEVDRELPSPSPSHSSSLSASPPPPERRALGGGGVSRRLSLARKSMPRAQSLPVGLDQMGDGQNHEVGRAQFFRRAPAQFCALQFCPKNLTRPFCSNPQVVYFVDDVAPLAEVVDPHGVLLQDIAGLRCHDRVVAVDGRPLRNGESAADALRNVRASRRIPGVIKRGDGYGKLRAQSYDTRLDEMGAAPAPGAAAGAGATPAIVVVQRQGPAEKEGKRGGGGFSGFAYSVRRHFDTSRAGTLCGPGEEHRLALELSSDLAHVRLAAPAPFNASPPSSTDSSLRGGTAAFGGMYLGGTPEASPDPSRDGSLRGGTAAFASLRGDTFGSLNLAGTGTSPPGSIPGSTNSSLHGGSLAQAALYVAMAVVPRHTTPLALLGFAATGER